MKNYIKYLNIKQQNSFKIFIVNFFVIFLFVLFLFTIKILETETISCPKIINSSNVPCTITNSGYYIIEEDIFSKKGYNITNIYGWQLKSLIIIKSVKNVIIDGKFHSISMKIKKSDELPFYIENVSNLTIKNIKIHKVPYAMELLKSNNVKIKNISVENVWDGIYLLSCNKCYIENISVNKTNAYGIIFYGKDSILYNISLKESFIAIEGKNVSVYKIYLDNSYIVSKELENPIFKDIYSKDGDILIILNEKNKRYIDRNYTQIIIINATNISIKNVTGNTSLYKIIVLNSKNIIINAKYLYNSIVIVENSSDIQFTGNIINLSVIGLKLVNNATFPKSSGILFLQNKSNLIIKDKFIKKIILKNCKNITLLNISIKNSMNSIIIKNSENISMINTTLYNISGIGIQIYNSNNVIIKNFKAFNVFEALVVRNSRIKLINSSLIKGWGGIIGSLSKLYLYNTSICKFKLYSLRLFNSSILFSNSVFENEKLYNVNKLFINRNFFCNFTSRYNPKLLKICFYYIDNKSIFNSYVFVKINNFTFSNYLKDKNCINIQLFPTNYKIEVPSIIDNNRKLVYIVIDNFSSNLTVTNISVVNNSIPLIIHCYYNRFYYNLTLNVVVPTINISLFNFTFNINNNTYNLINTTTKIIKLKEGKYILTFPKYLKIGNTSFYLNITNSMCNDSVCIVDLYNNVTLNVTYNILLPKYFLTFYFICNDKILNETICVKINNNQYCNNNTAILILNLTKGKYLINIPYKIKNCIFKKIIGKNFESNTNNLIFNLTSNAILTCIYINSTLNYTTHNTIKSNVSAIPKQTSLKRNIPFIIYILIIIIIILVVVILIYKLK